MLTSEPRIVRSAPVRFLYEGSIAAGSPSSTTWFPVGSTAMPAAPNGDSTPTTVMITWESGNPSEARSTGVGTLQPFDDQNVGFVCAAVFEPVKKMSPAAEPSGIASSTANSERAGTVAKTGIEMLVRLWS